MLQLHTERGGNELSDFPEMVKILRVITSFCPATRLFPF